MELTEKELSYFSIFEGITRLMPNDFVESEGSLVFVVDQFKLGKAIGKKGSNISRLKDRFKKRVLIVADSDDPESFIRNFFNNIDILSIEVRDVMDEKAFMVLLNEKDRGIAIGRDGERIKALKQLLKKKFDSTVHIRTKRVLSEEM